LIWGKWEQNYFSENPKKDSTALSTNRPTGKSPAANYSFVQLGRAGRARNPIRMQDGPEASRSDGQI
jgi:hypothetical protein